MRHSKRVAATAVALIALTGCTRQEIATWVAWADEAPEAAAVYANRPDVQESLIHDTDQDGVIEPDAPPAPAGESAPVGLSDCAEMMWYANQVGLPARFESIGWRESNCRNEDGVRTSCCYGYWQLHQMHFPIPECGVNSASDVNSDTDGDKRRQACAAKWLYDQVGMSAWG